MHLDTSAVVRRVSGLIAGRVNGRGTQHWCGGYSKGQAGSADLVERWLASLLVVTARQRWKIADVLMSSVWSS